MTLYRSSDQDRRLGAPSVDGPERSTFRRDYARLLHSASFRRLQGKTQLFAGIESDFFRNRLTHSLEVAQISKAIAQRLNLEESLQELGWQVDLDLVEFAGLAHDLGHPPFGHTGEMALDELMLDAGGFEGNAQTLRILARLEKKLDEPGKQFDAGSPVWFRGTKDVGYGLNLAARSYAGILKYDKSIRGQRAAGSTVEKGFYESEREVVDWVRAKVLASAIQAPLKTIECQIMDLADDIAYSTYDIEDAFKGALLTPLDLLYPPDSILEDVAERVTRELEVQVDAQSVQSAIVDLLQFSVVPEIGLGYQLANYFTESGFLRTFLTSYLVGTFSQAVRIESLREDEPALSQVGMAPEIRLQVAAMKHLTYSYLISSQRLQLVAHRGREIVSRIYAALSGGQGEKLLPEDYREKLRQAPTDVHRKRVVCDFIAGMTDRYATEFFARLTSDSFHSMFKPH